MSSASGWCGSFESGGRLFSKWGSQQARQRPSMREKFAEPCRCGPRVSPGDSSGLGRWTDVTSQAVRPLSVSAHDFLIMGVVVSVTGLKDGWNMILSPIPQQGERIQQ